jgi:hypothetical protein
MIDKAWRDYELRVLDPLAPEIQRRETKRAFYAGAQAFLGGLLEGLGVGDEPTAPDMRLMDSCVAELEAFAAEVQAGRA